MPALVADTSLIRNPGFVAKFAERLATNMFRRLFRWILIASLVAIAAFGGFAWTVTHPSIGTPLESEPREGDEKLWSFGFVGDTHAGMTGGVVDDIFSRMADADLQLVLHLGDMVDQGESEQQWQEFIDLARRHNLRLLPVVGNHDAMPNYSDRGDIRFRRHFPWLPATFYHARHQNINFLMLNSEMPLHPGARQRQFLSRQLVEHPGTTIVCLHRPVFTSSQRDWANKYLRQIWLHSALTSTDALLVLTGHNHYYERTNPLDGITYITSGGGTANVYSTQPPDRNSAVVVAGKPHYGIIDVFADRLEVNVFAVDGSRLDQFAVEVRKPRHEPGHQFNPGSIELPDRASLPKLGNAGEAEPTHYVPADQLPRPW